MANLLGTAAFQTYREAQKGFGRFVATGGIWILANTIQLVAILLAGALGFRYPALFLTIYGLSSVVALALISIKAPAALRSSVALVAWPTALVLGSVPEPLHRTVRVTLGYVVQVEAWWSLVSGRYPWPPNRSRHPVQLLCTREPQRRWTVLLRPVLVLPALVLASVLLVVHACTAVAAWFVALVLGRTTAGLRELGAFCLRYAAETVAYLLLLTPDYPRLAPRAVVPDQPPVEPQVAQ
jgi:hypothetical protein